MSGRLFHELLAELAIDADRPPDAGQWRRLLDRMAAAPAPSASTDGDVRGGTWRTFVEAAPDLMLLTDVSSQITYTNRPILTPQAEEGIGAPLAVMIAAEHHDRLLAHLAESIRTGLPVDFEARATFDAGPLTWHSLRIGVIDPGGGVIGLSVMVSDISRRKSLEQANQRFRTVLNAANEAFLVVATDGGHPRFVDANETAVRLLGYRFHDLMRASVTTVIPELLESGGGHSGAPGTFSQDWLRKLGERHFAVTMEMEVRHADGRRVPVERTMLHIDQGDQHFLLVTLMDLNHRRSLETALAAERAKTVFSSKMATLGEMAGGIAHEINNPLTVIDGFAKHVVSMLGQPDPEVPRLIYMMGKITNMTDRIARIVRGLRTFSRDASQDPLVGTPTVSLIDDALSLCSEKLKRDQIGLEIRLPDPPPTIHCRPTEIAQVLLNLIVNARDAILPLLERWIRISVSEEADAVVFTVTDSGHGIAPTVADRILEPFFTTKEVGKGTGLGLSIASGIAASHNGSLTYTLDGGHTAFRLVLPKIKDVAAA